MTERTRAHKARWRATKDGRRLVCICGWPGEELLAPGHETAEKFLAHVREARAEKLAEALA